MLQGRVLLALLIVLIWGIVPLTIKQWGRVPHTHILFGPITQAEMEAHLAAEENHTETTDNLQFRKGWILSVPFGDLSAFLAFMLVMAPVAGIALRLTQRVIVMAARECRMQSLAFAIPHPPPRFSI